MTVPPARKKWRPTVGLIIFAVLASVAMLPLVGLFFFRLYDNQLIRQTQAELIAQSKVLAAVFAPRGRKPSRLAALSLGADCQPEARSDSDDRVTPIRPALDLAGNDLLIRRPDARPAGRPADPAYIEIGQRMMPIILDTQKVTLAGFRILDPQGVVIAAAPRWGNRSAIIEEVAAALKGQYHAALRIRIPDKKPPPIYSISRASVFTFFLGDARDRRQPRRRVIYTSRTPSNIFDHLYQERGKFLLAALTVVGATVIIGLVFWRTITGPDARTGGPHRADRAR
jgi:hypothetical protein